jgi:AraC family transcriptional regulator of adaptative response / DNA-3-methyladenine glycosylase II
MNLDADSCYRALMGRDPRFDGVFFVGVATTRIYCRPICPARTPYRENCKFYPSAAAAERAGFRPCLRCRPELAPGNAGIDAASRLAAVAASRIEDGALTDTRVGELARELGVSDRHLRRVFESEFGVSPIELAQTHRLLLAKRLLTDTRLPVIEVAYASGFSSLRRFNALFSARYRLNPTDLRKARKAGPGTPADTLVCEVAYRPPLDWPGLLAFLAGRALKGVEAVEGNRYLRTVVLGKHRGWISVQPCPGKNTLRVELAASLAPALSQVLARVKRLFDLTAEPEHIAAQLGPLASRHPGLRVPGAFDGFELGVRSILGQRISVAAATTLAGRFATTLGEPVDTPFERLNRLSPAAERVAETAPEEIAGLGITLARARSIVALAAAAASRDIVLEPRAGIDCTVAKLLELPGIGEWTAQYIAMRALSWPDAFPHTDLGIRKALDESNPRRVLEIADAWRPWRSYAVMHLWRSLEVA